MRRRQAISTLGSFAGAALLGAGTAVRAQGVPADRIVLGQSAPFTGPATELGLQYHLGAQLHLSLIHI